MDSQGNQGGHSEGIKVAFQVHYQPRKKADLFKMFMIDNWRSLRGFKNLGLYSLPLAVVLVVSMVIVLQVIGVIVFGFYLFVIIGYGFIWRHQRKYEYSRRLEAALIKERTFRYGNYGIVHRILSKNGLTEEKYAWVRFSYLVRWDDQLFLLPAKKKAVYFMLRKDEIGEEEFIDFEEFAKTKLPFKKLENAREIFVGSGFHTRIKETKSI